MKVVSHQLPAVVKNGHFRGRQEQNTTIALVTRENILSPWNTSHPKNGQGVTPLNNANAGPNIEQPYRGHLVTPVNLTLNAQNALSRYQSTEKINKKQSVELVGLDEYA